MGLAMGVSKSMRIASNMKRPALGMEGIVERRPCSIVGAPGDECWLALRAKVEFSASPVL